MLEWWCHDMETLSALLALCDGNLLVTSGFPSPVKQTFDIYLMSVWTNFEVSINKLFNKHSSGRWSEMSWCYCDNTVIRTSWGAVVTKYRYLIMWWPCSGPTLTLWGRDKMPAISQMTFSNAFSWMKMYQFWLRFHWNSFPRVRLTIYQYWFR